MNRDEVIRQLEQAIQWSREADDGEEDVCWKCEEGVLVSRLVARTALHALYVVAGQDSAAEKII